MNLHTNYKLELEVLKCSISSLRFLQKQHILHSQPSIVNHNNSNTFYMSLSLIKYDKKLFITIFLLFIFCFLFLNCSRIPPGDQLNFTAFYITIQNSVWFCLQLVNPQVPIITSPSCALQKFPWFPSRETQVIARKIKSVQHTANRAWTTETNTMWSFFCIYKGTANQYKRSCGPEFCVR